MIQNNKVENISLLKDFMHVFFHWFSFGIVASMLPFLVSVDLTSENFFYGTLRVIEEATINGDIVLALIPVMGALIGETVLRKFWSNNVEIIASISGLVIFVILLSFSMDHQMSKIETLTPERESFIINNTIWIFSIMLVYAITVMIFSSLEREK